MNDFKFTQEQLQDAMFRATDYGNIPFSMQNFMVLQYIESLKVVSEPTERMYSRAEMWNSYQAGYNRCQYNYSGQSDEEYVPRFQEFIESLNTPKP